MASMIRTASPPVEPALKSEKLPPLENGDHLDQKTFHARYEAMPPGTRAELIGGVVFMSSPLKRPHGSMHFFLGGWLRDYGRATPGTDGFVAATTILADDNEPQPDLCLLITVPGLGQTRGDEEGYIEGPPELVLAIASATESIDLHKKKSEYERTGVKEYVVVALRQKKIFWFISRQGKFEAMAPDSDGIFRSKVFPGLWLDPDAALRKDDPKLMAVLRQGLATAEHAAFVAKLSGA